MIDLSNKIALNPWPSGAEQAIALTFDDWTPGHLDVVVPLLNDMSVKATFFVTLNNFSMRPNRDHWWDLQLTQDQGHEIGNHTISHSDLTKATTKQQFNEVQLCAKQIEHELIDCQLYSFAGPYGKSNDEVSELVLATHHLNRSYCENIEEYASSLANVQSISDLPAIGLSELTTNEQISHLLNVSKTHDQPLIWVFHGVFDEFRGDAPNSYYAISSQRLTQIIEYTHTQSHVWFSSLKNIISYQNAIKNISVRIEQVGESISLSLINIPDDFNQSISLRLSGVNISEANCEFSKDNYGTIIYINPIELKKNICFKPDQLETNMVDEPCT